ncbi:MAG: hypothetical protein Q8Q48_04545 [Candidatus Staskawiczbacteria bacterium]|nr:hypothetical protein [Candidatus Staskawiczbacteria bacterium]
MKNQEGPREPEEIPSQKEFLLQTRDARRENAPEGQKEAAELQALQYESTLLGLMSRIEDPKQRAEMVNALNMFLGKIENQAISGDSTKPLHPARVTELKKFFEEEAKELQLLGRSKKSK